eukprot:3139571-Rhodomonas_salina.3
MEAQRQMEGYGTCLSIFQHPSPTAGITSPLLSTTLVAAAACTDADGSLNPDAIAASTFRTRPPEGSYG